MSKLGPISHFLSPVSCDSLLLQGLRCELGAGVKRAGVISLTGHWKFNMARHDKELSVDLKKIIVALHKDGVGYKKIEDPETELQLRKGLAMVDQRSWVHVLSIISRGCVWEIDVLVLPALLQRLKGRGGSACQCSDHTPHTASNQSAWLSCQKEASSKDDAQESP